MVTTPDWLSQAATLPSAFAQVREDPLLDAAVVRRVGPCARVMMIASGGCTAAHLAAAADIASLHLADMNPAQVGLARLKLSLLTTCGPVERMRLLGHAPMPPDERAAALESACRAAGLSAAMFGPADRVAEWGPDFAGRYERLFAELQRVLAPWRAELDSLLRLRDPAGQSRRAAPETAPGRALDEAFERVFSLPNLIRLFGEGATSNRRRPFSEHFAERTRDVLARLPAADNPWLWQLLAGAFPAGAEYPWLTAPAPARMPEITWSVQPMADALRSAKAGFDVVHLSNILDWLSPAEAAEVLAAAAGALRPGGLVVIRQLNSTLDIPASGPGFDWLPADGADLLARDRSFFYRAIHLGRRR